jgi:hypothetical protein
VDQGSVEWHKLRRGIPTASEAHRIIQPQKLKRSESRKKYLCELLASRLKNWQRNSIDHLEHVARGKEHEPDAVFAFEETNKVETKKVGFITVDSGRFGASPDRFIIEGMVPLEIKCPSEVQLMEYQFFGLGGDYRAQVQTQIWAAEADHGVFNAYNVGVPRDFTLRTDRDDAFLREWRPVLDEFCDDLDQMEATARTWGIWEEYQWRTAHDRELGIRRDPLTTAEEMAAVIERETRPGDLYRMGA